jgi:hypothetical protein
MKIYYTCEYCNQVYAVTSVDGVEGAVEIKGICDDCAMEIGLDREIFYGKSPHSL